MFDQIRMLLANVRSEMLAMQHKIEELTKENADLKKKLEKK
jgi:hypothetical protein